MQTLVGSCHCQRVRFTIETDFPELRPERSAYEVAQSRPEYEPPTLRSSAGASLRRLTTCDCSICRRKNALMVKVHESLFTLLAGADALTEYQFHTRAARHYFCASCGIYPFHRKRVTPDFVGVNVYCLNGFDPTGIPVRATRGAAMD